MKDNIKRVYVALISFIVVFVVYKVSTFFLKIGFNDAAAKVYYIVGGIYLVYSLLEYLRYRRNYSFDELEYYNRVYSVLKKVDGDVTPLQGVTVKLENNKELLDSIIFTTKGVFNIVPCSYVGDIIIKEDGNWYKEDRKGSYMISSPITKIKKNREVLSKIYEEEDIIDVVLMLSDFVEIIGEGNFQVPIVRNEDLCNYIDEYEINEEYEKDELYDMFYPIIDEEKDLEGMKKLYTKYLDNKWKFRSRLAAVSLFAVLFFLNIIY